MHSQVCMYVHVSTKALPIQAAAIGEWQEYIASFPGSLLMYAIL